MFNQSIQNEAVYENGWSDGYYGNAEASDHAAYLNGYLAGAQDADTDNREKYTMPVMLSHSVVFVPSDGAHPVRRVTYP